MLYHFTYLDVIYVFFFLLVEYLKICYDHYLPYPFRFILHSHLPISRQMTYAVVKASLNILIAQ